MNRQATLTTIICSVAVFLIALEITIISVALPEIEAAFDGSSRAAVSWVFTAYNITVAAGLLIGGWLAERNGRRRVFVAGLWIFTAGSLLSGLAPSLAVLIAARVVQGLGGALLIPASLALILHAVDDDHRETAIGIWGAMAGLAAAIGPTAGAVLVDAAGWRWVFLVNVPIAAVAAVASRMRLVDSSDPTIARRVDLVAVPAGAIGVGLLVFAIVASGALGIISPVVLGSLAAAVVGIAVLVRRTDSHPAPVFDPAIVMHRSFSVAGVGTLFFVAGFTGWLVLAPTFLVDLWGYATIRSGLAIAPAPVMMAIVAGPAGRWATAVGHRTVIAVGALSSTAAVAWWAIRIGEQPDYLGAFLPGAVLLGAGVGLGFPMLAAAAMRDVDPERYAMAAAGNTTMRQIAMAVGIAVAVTIVDAEADGVADLARFRASWIVCGALFALTALTVRFLYPDRPADARPANQQELIPHV